MERLFIKNALIGSLWWLITWLLDVARWRTISIVQAFTKVLAWWFVSHFMTPVVSESLSISDQGFVSAILWILGYKIIEYATSWEFFNNIKTIILSLLKK